MKRGCDPTWLTACVCCLLQMLSACSNPNIVMQQQMAFDQLDSKSRPIFTKRQAGRAGAGGAAARKGVRSGNNKPRRGWMALF